MISDRKNEMRTLDWRLVIVSFLFSCTAVARAGESETLPSSLSSCNAQEWKDHPVLCRMVELAITEPATTAKILNDWAHDHGLLVDVLPLLSDAQTAVSRKLLSTPTNHVDQDKKQLPVVLAHGMGDSCFNDGMQRVTQRVAQLLGGGEDIYTTCIATGKNQQEDTMNGYFLNMDESVDVFAQAVQKDERLKAGFHAMGFSQGNNVIRGYIAKHNNPPVHTFISVNGVNAGIGAVPYCRPSTKDVTSAGDATVSLPSVCDLLMENASRAAYTKYAQQHSFQANYWRDPRPVAADRYKTFGQLAQWNNEGHSLNQTLRDNWAKTSRFVWVMANQDRMVWPKEGEHWGAPDPNDPFQHVLPMNETEWYQKDLFGLKTAQEAGKNVFESFDGDHLQFTTQDFERWVTTYFKN